MSSNLVIAVVMEVQSGAEVSRLRFVDCERPQALYSQSRLTPGTSLLS